MNSFDLNYYVKLKGLVGGVIIIMYQSITNSRRRCFLTAI